MVALGLCLPAHSQTVADWKFESQRPEIAPEYAVDKKVLFEGSPTLSLRGNGKAFAAGHWYTIAQAEPGTFYRFRTQRVAPWSCETYFT